MKNIMIEQNPSSKANPITVHKFRFHSEEIHESSARRSDEPRRPVFPDTESIVDWYALQAPLRIPMTYSDLKDEYQKFLTNYQNLEDQCRVQERITKHTARDKEPSLLRGCRQLNQDEWVFRDPEELEDPEEVGCR